MSQQRTPTVAVVGGGLAGLAAGCALAGSGFRVSLFEKRPYLGGRASSYEHPGTGEVVDNCQHILLGCCTNLIEFYKRIGVEDKIRWYKPLTFIEPGGRQSVIKPSFLPAPFHASLSFLSADFLNLRDKLAIGRALLTLIPRTPAENGETFLSWLQRHGQTSRAIERFWLPILVSALNEQLDRMSVPYAAQVIRESFLKSPGAGRFGVPMVPLTELYNRAGDYIKTHHGEINLRSGVESFELLPKGVGVRIADSVANFDFAVIAVPFDALAKILPDGTAEEEKKKLERFEFSPITGIHLWFDRKITDLEHAVLLDRTIQWLFQKSEFQEGRQNGEAGSYLELVVSASRSLVEKSRQEIIDLALAELAEFFPDVRNAKLTKATVIKEIKASFSPLPRVDEYRPGYTTDWTNIFLAGDWTATGWPATMEGAVRSGFGAAECVAKAMGRKNTKFAAPDLPPAGFMKLFG
ncbi:MAG TPA: hydroxysqualene dehydroxylase HpnE [Terriglobales bacterium]|jgi:zeta-carotene desaturase